MPPKYEIHLFLKYISELENVQRHITRRIRSIKHLSCPERLEVPNFEPLELRSLISDLLKYYKIPNNLISINFYDQFTARTSSLISTPSTGPCILKPFCRTNKMANNFFLDRSMLGTYSQLP